MKQIQKIAIFIFVVLTSALATSAVAIAILYAKYGFPKAWSGFACMGLVGITGLTPLLFKKDPSKIEYDERDYEIQRKAALVGFGMAFLVVGMATMVPFMILGPHSSIAVFWLPQIFGAAGITNYYAWSIAILAQYGWRSNKDEN